MRNPVQSDCPDHDHRNQAGMPARPQNSHAKIAKLDRSRIRNTRKICHFYG